QIHQDRPGFEERPPLVAIDDRGNAVVGAEPQELRLELLALGDVDRVGRILEPAFLEHDRDLAAVGRGPGVKIDHAGLLTRDGSGFAMPVALAMHDPIAGASKEWPRER